MHVNCAYLDLLLTVLFMLAITAQQILYSIFFQHSNCLIAFCYNITFLFCNIPDRYPNGIAFVCLLFFVLFENISLIKRCMAGKEMQNLGLCSELTHTQHLRWGDLYHGNLPAAMRKDLGLHGLIPRTTLFSCLYDKPGLLRTYSNRDPYEIKWCCNHDDINNVVQCHNIIYVLVLC